VNKKCKYIRRNYGLKLNPFQLLSLMHARDGQEISPMLKDMWLKAESGIIDVWRRIGPGTRPRTWWLVHYPAEYQQLCSEAGTHPDYPAMKMYPAASDEYSLLLKLGELVENEVQAEPRACDFNEFCEAYGKAK
jgi:hypothetical protein